MRKRINLSHTGLAGPALPRSQLGWWPGPCCPLAVSPLGEFLKQMCFLWEGQVETGRSCRGWGIPCSKRAACFLSAPLFPLALREEVAELAKRTGERAVGRRWKECLNWEGDGRGWGEELRNRCGWLYFKQAFCIQMSWPLAKTILSNYL